MVINHLFLCNKRKKYEANNEFTLIAKPIPFVSKSFEGEHFKFLNENIEHAQLQRVFYLKSNVLRKKCEKV